MQTIDEKVRGFVKLHQDIEGDILEAESECVGPLHSAWEHQRHAIHDFFLSLEKENEDERAALLGEAEGHLYSAAIYSWEEVAARELALTKQLLEQTRVKKYAAAAEKYNYAIKKFSAGRKVPRDEYQNAASFFKECSALCRDARTIAEPITLRDDVALWITAGALIASLITLGLKLSGVF